MTMAQILLFKLKYSTRLLVLFAKVTHPVKHLQKSLLWFALTPCITRSQWPPKIFWAVSPACRMVPVKIRFFCPLKEGTDRVKLPSAILPTSASPEELLCLFPICFKGHPIKQLHESCHPFTGSLLQDIVFQHCHEWVTIHLHKCPKTFWGCFNAIQDVQRSHGNWLYSLGAAHGSSSVMCQARERRRVFARSLPVGTGPAGYPW